MTSDERMAAAGRRGVRMVAGLALASMTAACAVDVTEYTPFGTGGDETQVASDGDSDPLTTGSVKQVVPARTAKADRAGRTVASAVVVARGDTLYSLARRHRISVDRIAEANEIASPYTIRVGQRLAVPGTPAPEIAPAAAPVHDGAIRQLTPVPVRGAVRVGEGDTLYSIARLNRVDLADLMAANAITDPTRVRKGQVLMLPYQRVAATDLATVEYTGSVARRARVAQASSADDRRARADRAYTQVMTDYRVVPGQSILAPF